MDGPSLPAVAAQGGAGGLAALPLAGSLDSLAALGELSSTLLVLGVVGGVGALVGICVLALVHLMGAIAKRTKLSLDDELTSRLALPLALMLGSLAAGVTLAALAARLDSGLAVFTKRALTVVFIVSAAWALVRTVRILLDQAGKRKARLLPATRLGSRILAVVLYAAAFLTILSEYGIAITPILTGLGIAGLAVALALQDTLANFFAGIWVQSGQPLQPGHYVKLEEEKLEGYVEQVGWRTTRLRTLSGNLIVIPNAKLAQDVVTDHNLPTPDLSVMIEFRTGYEADPQQVCAILVEETRAVMEHSDQFLPGSEPFAQLAGLDEYALRFQLFFRAKEFVAQYAPQAEIRSRVLARFKKDGIRIPYPTRHNLQEAVESPAKRVPSAPGGFAPHNRPPRPPPDSGKEPAEGPRVTESNVAKADIAAKKAEQEAEQASQAADGKGAVPGDRASDADERRKRDGRDAAAAASQSVEVDPIE